MTSLCGSSSATFQWTLHQDTWSASNFDTVNANISCCNTNKQRGHDAESATHFSILANISISLSCYSRISIRPILIQTSVKLGEGNSATWQNLPYMAERFWFSSGGFPHWSTRRNFALPLQFCNQVKHPIFSSIGLGFSIQHRNAHKKQFSQKTVSR